MHDTVSPCALRCLVLAGLTLVAGWVETRAAAPQMQRNVEFSRHGEQSLKADIYRPHGKGPFPGVLMVHGGGWMSGSKLQVYANARRLAKNGYVVVAINYRLAPNHKFPAQVDDCLAALRWMRTHANRYGIDAGRIAGYGYSAGGHLVSLLGLRNPESDDDRLQAIVAGGAPNDFRQLPQDSSVLKYWLGGNRGELPDTYRDASPRAFVSADDPPVFLYHGDQDRLVDPAACKEFHRELKSHGLRTEMYIVAEAGHLRTFFDRQANERAMGFLDDILKPPSRD